MKLTIQDVMTRKVISLRANASIDEAFTLLLGHQISGLPVVDDEGRLVGVLSERDLLRMLYHPDVKVQRALDYASLDVVTIRAGEQLSNVVEVFLSRPYRRVPVVDDDGKLVGVVSRRDVVRTIHELRRQHVSAADGQSRPEPAACPPIGDSGKLSNGYSVATV